VTAYHGGEKVWDAAHRFFNFGKDGLLAEVAVAGSIGGTVGIRLILVVRE